MLNRKPLFSIYYLLFPIGSSSFSKNLIIPEAVMFLKRKRITKIQH